MCLVLATNVKQASVILNYVVGILESVPAFAAMVVGKTNDSVSLSNGIDIEVRAAGFRGLRGITAIIVICDELPYWLADEASRNPDKEILDAVRPALATTDGPLVAIGSPYAKHGEMWRAYRRHFGEAGDPHVLVVKGTTRDLNPNFPQWKVDLEMERDEAHARSEYLAEFRSDIESFVAQEAIDAAIVPGRYEIPYIPGVKFTAYTDPSGGAQDSLTLALAYTEGDTAVLAAVREVKPPFSPELSSHRLLRAARQLQRERGYW